MYNFYKHELQWPNIRVEIKIKKFDVSFQWNFYQSTCDNKYSLFNYYHLFGATISWQLIPLRFYDNGLKEIEKIIGLPYIFFYFPSR